MLCSKGQPYQSVLRTTFFDCSCSLQLTTPCVVLLFSLCLPSLLFSSLFYRWPWLALVTWLCLVLSFVSTHFPRSPRLRACSKTPEISSLQWNHWNLKQGTSQISIRVHLPFTDSFSRIDWVIAVARCDMQLSRLPSNNSTTCTLQQKCRLEMLQNVNAAFDWIEVHK